MVVTYTCRYSSGNLIPNNYSATYSYTRDKMLTRISANV